MLSQIMTEGSSPRMRGAQQRYLNPKIHNRIIPADAGSTNAQRTTTRESKDHPRGCGEHGTEAVLIPHCQGSSPRMRGARREFKCRMF